MTKILLARIAPSANVLPPPPAGIVGERYRWRFALSGISHPYRYTLAGTLPAGVEWYPDARSLMGVPTTRGSYPVSVNVIGADRIPISFPFVIEVAAPPMILVGALDSGPLGTAIKGSLAVFGGTPGFTLEGVDGNPPTGITFVMTAGVITATGLTTSAGQFVWSFLIRDSAGATARIRYSLTVGGGAVAYHYVTKSGDHIVTKGGDHLITHNIEG